MLKQFSWIKCAFSARDDGEIHVGGVSAIRGRREAISISIDPFQPFSALFSSTFIVYVQVVNG